MQPVDYCGLGSDSRRHLHIDIYLSRGVRKIRLLSGAKVLLRYQVLR